MDEDIWGTNDVDQARLNNKNDLSDDTKTTSFNKKSPDTKEDDGDNIFENMHDINHNARNKHYKPNLASTNPFAYDLEDNGNINSNNPIRIISREERKGKLRKYTVYMIESSVFASSRTVARRFNDFKWLQTMLSMEYMAIFIAPLPPDNAFDRFNDDFVSQRQYDLERCLNRLNANKILNKTTSFELFLCEQDDATFEEHKKLFKKQLNERTEYGVTSLLMRCFPDLNEAEIPDFLSLNMASNDTENMYKLDIPRVREFFMRSHERLTELNKICFNLFKMFQSIDDELIVFSDCLTDLYDAEYNDKPHCVMDVCTERSDIREFVHKWNDIEQHRTMSFYKHFLLSLRYEVEDIKAILDIFKRYDIVFAKYKKEKTNLKKLNDKYPDKNHQEFEDKWSEIKNLLDIICKIILINQTPKLWDKKIKDYNNGVREYIKTITQKLF